jgi:hypothetical protein
MACGGGGGRLSAPEYTRAELTDGRVQGAAEYAGEAATLLGWAEKLVAPRGITSCRGPALEVT